MPLQTRVASNVRWESTSSFGAKLTGRSHSHPDLRIHAYIPGNGPTVRRSFQGGLRVLRRRLFSNLRALLLPRAKCSLIQSILRVHSIRYSRAGKQKRPPIKADGVE